METASRRPEKLIGALTGRLAYFILKGIVTDSRFEAHNLPIPTRQRIVQMTAV
jgi:hypothetical protein